MLVLYSLEILEENKWNYDGNRVVIIIDMIIIQSQGSFNFYFNLNWNEK